ncbi:TIGR00288 family NYN domain-containing protein [Methanococcus maripaludis]|nr:TIGR00288 family NYN domain-containing protein [Methanococcus maripaludis]
MWKKLGNLKKFYVKTSRKGTNRMALLIDGPNMLRKEFNVDLDKVRDALEQFGDIVVGRVYLNQYASDKLIEAIANQGFEPRISAGDVDVEMAVDGTELIFNKNLDTLVYMTRDADFLPAIRKAKERGKQIIVVGAEPGFSTAIQNIADHVIRVEEDFELDKEKLEQKKREREHSISSSESASEENTEVQKNSEPKKSSTDSFKDGISNSINWLKK